MIYVAFHVQISLLEIEIILADNLVDKEVDASKMASAVVDPRTTLKCRKCRYLLLEQPPHRILEDEDSAQEVASTFNICDDNLPQWIADAVEEVRHYNNITQHIISPQESQN